MNKVSEFLFRQLFETVKVAQLRFRSWRGFVEPVPLVGLPVDTERSADGIAVLAIFKPILLRKDLDPLFQAPADDRNTEPESNVIYIDAALGRQ